MKILIVSLANTLIALLLFIFFSTISNGLILIDVIASLLSIAMLSISVITLYKNKKQLNKVYYVLLITNILFIILIIYTFITNHII